MPYSIKPTGSATTATDVEYTVDFNHDELSIHEFNRDFAAFITALQAVDGPINRFRVELTNTGYAGASSEEELFDYLDAIIGSLKTLSDTLNSLEEQFAPQTVEVDFNTDEEVADVIFNQAIFDLINHIPNASKVQHLVLNLRNIVMCENDNSNGDTLSSVYLTDDFFQQFTSLETFNFDMNYIDGLSTHRVAVFIANHANLKSITLNLRGGSNDFDLRQVMLNKHLTSVTFKHTALYPLNDSNQHHQNLSDQLKYDYWTQLGFGIKRHSHLKSFELDIQNDFYPNDHENIRHAMINNFLYEIAHNRNLDRLCIKIYKTYADPINNARTALAQQYFMEHASLLDLTIKLEGIHLVEYLPLRDQTLANRAILTTLAESPDAYLNIPTLPLAKYIHHVVSQAYQQNDLGNAYFMLDYISKMFKKTFVYNLPNDITKEKILSFLQPKDVCKLSAAAGGFFRQKRLELVTAAPHPLVNEGVPLTH